MQIETRSGSGPIPRVIGLARLMGRAFAGEDLAPLGEQLIARAGADPDDAAALLDLATVLQIRGERELALDLHRRATAAQQLYRLPAATAGAPLRLLALMGPGWDPLESTCRHASLSIL